MPVYCKSCGEAVHSEDVNLDRLVAKCRFCHAVFDISSQIDGGNAARDGESPLQRRRPRVPMPQAITVRSIKSSALAQGGGSTPYRSVETSRRPDLEISRRWFTAQHIFLLFFCFAWDGFLIFWYSVVPKTGAGIFFLLFPVVHVAVGVSLTYSTFAGLVNHTRIRVTDEGLSIRHGPIPWAGNRDISRASLDQLYTEEVISQGKSKTITYSLNAVLEGGAKVALLKGLPSADQAMFIEQAVEERLGIVDVAVADEYRALKA